MINVIGGRRFAVMACAAAVLSFGTASAVSAQQISMSAGGNIFYVGDYGGGIYGAQSSDGDDKIHIPWNGFGFGGFFDYTYAEASLAFVFGGGHPVEVYNGRTTTDKDVDVSFTSLNIGVLGKYPLFLVFLPDNIQVFPAVGFDWAIVLSGEVKEGRFKEEVDNPGDASALWLKFGGGLDYSINDRLFVRPELLYGIRFANKLSSDLADDMDGKTMLGHGLTIKIGAGYRF